jgi:membrane protease YdiL (CAAX protease family)
MRTMNLSWPPRAIGLGTPLNLATLLRLPRAEIARRALECVTLAILGATLVAAIDYFFFEAVTARATPALDEHPTPTARVLITFIGGLLEELFFRLLFATAVASVVWLALRRLIAQREVAVTLAQWTGTIIAMIHVGMWHVWMSSIHTGDARIMAINSVGNLLYGWVYWRRGLEFAVLTHGVLNATLYLGFPLLH